MVLPHILRISAFDQCSVFPCLKSLDKAAARQSCLARILEDAPESGWATVSSDMDDLLGQTDTRGQPTQIFSAMTIFAEMGQPDILTIGGRINRKSEHPARVQQACHVPKHRFKISEVIKDAGGEYRVEFFGTQSVHNRDQIALEKKVISIPGSCGSKHF